MRIYSQLFIGVASSALLLGGASAMAATEPAVTSNTLQEVIVTAQKRPENVQKAPLAVTSLNADALATAHVTGATDLSRVVPDLRVSVGGAAGDPGGSSAVFSIRGLGASATGPQGSAGVAVHFDGVYRQSGVSNGEFFDLERVEVDPGPQGTLYGRSAAAGAVNIIPNKPSRKFEGELGLEAGNYGAIRSWGAVNLPLSDTLFLRGAFQTLNHDGYLSNGYDDADSKAGRLQLLYEATPQLTVRLYGDYLNIGGRGASNIFVGGANLPAIAGVAAPLQQANIRDRSIANYCIVNGLVVNTCVQSVSVTKSSVHADIGYKMSWGTLTLTPSYSEQKETTLFSNAPLPLSYYNQQPYNQTQTDFEARLSDPGTGLLKWVGGFNVYFHHVDIVNNQSVNPITGQLPVFGKGFPGPTTGVATGIAAISGTSTQSSEQDSYAGFGQVTLPVRSWLRVTAGARYNSDMSTYAGVLTTNSQTIYYLNGAAFPVTTSNITSPVTTGPLATSAKFNATTFRLAVDADITPTSLVYGSVGTGYKPGGLNDGGTPSTNTTAQLGVLGSQLTPTLTAAQVAAYEPSNVFGPERVTHYEIGSKNRIFGNRLQINDAIYYDDYSNYQNGQTQVVNPLIYRVQGFTVTNAGKAQVYGNELSVNFKATPNDVVGFSLNYLRTKFTSYVAPAFLTPSGPAPAVNLAGKTLPNAPEWSSTVSYQHIFELTNGSSLTASIFSAISSDYWVDYAESPGTHQDAFTRTTLDVTWTDPNHLWKLSAFANNLENHNITSFGLNSSGYSSIHLDPPRVYGVSASRKF